MNTQIEDIIDQVYNKYNGVSRADINRMFKSEFKLIQETINKKGDESVTLMYVGTVKPTPFRLKQLSKKDE